jgi:hypothetical protein
MASELFFLSFVLCLETRKDVPVHAYVYSTREGVSSQSGAASNIDVNTEKAPL